MIPVAAQPETRVIRPLPPLVVNQIAAGEVVERPASVVKELLDNALDAGATRITLEIEAGGVELVRVADDGCGVERAQAALMLAPHATSKLRDVADLDAIATMGFRGEALASIASVARVCVRSRPRHDPDPDAGWRIDAEGDTRSDPRPDACPVGTSVAVRNLFFNTPARRKFLRTAATEEQRCLDVLRDLAVAHPRVGFRAVVDGREALDLPPADGPRERILAVLGRELEPQLLDAHADRFDDARGVALFGLVGTPALARATNRAQKVFINGRPIRDKTIAHALKEAYRGLIEPSRHPTAVLLFEMAPAAVDVNVHPTKAEVRFRDPGLLHAVTLRAVREALSRADLTPRALSPTLAPLGRAPGAEEILPGVAPTREPAADARAFIEYFQRVGLAGPQPRLDLRPSVDPPTIAPPPASDARAAAPPAAAPAGQADPPAPAAAPNALPPASPPGALQVHNAYLVTQDEQGLVIIDQHALHERVMFEALLARLRQGPMESQRLLTPLIVRCTPAQTERLRDLEPLLARLGIDAAPAGPAAVALHAFPTLLSERGVDAGEFLAELLERADAGALPETDEAALHEALDMMACKAAVKAGDRLGSDELAALLALREAVERSSNCPHGRPTTIRLTLRDLARQFGRA